MLVIPDFTIRPTMDSAPDNFATLCNCPDLIFTFSSQVDGILSDIFRLRFILIFLILILIFIGPLFPYWGIMGTCILEVALGIPKKKNYPRATLVGKFILVP